jgi:hypothetical protein
MLAYQRVGPGTNRSFLLPCLIMLVAGHSLAVMGQTARRDEKNTKRPVLPIRLMNLTTYGDSIAKWLEPEATNFAQINWRNNNLNVYAFRKESKPKDFLEKVEASRTSLRARAEQAKRLGLLVYLNEYELNFPDFIARETLGPAAEREKFMEEKLYELFVACPWLEGYMITPTESKLGVANPTELKAVVMGAYKGMKRAEKQLGQKRYLFVRSWLSAASKLAAVRNYFPITTDPEVAKDIIVVAKDGLGDFVMRRPLNPLFGAVYPHSICAEFDVSVSEYRSLGWYPQGPADLWSYRMQQLALTPGVVGINIHTGRLNEVPGKTPEEMFPRFKEGRIVYPFHGGVKWSPWHHLNIYTLYRLLKNPWEQPRKIYEDWARENYGGKAVKPLANILLIADDALYHGMLTFGVNLNNHSGFVIGGEGEKLIQNTASSIKYQLQLQPYLAPLFEITSDTADRAISEKEQSLQLVDSMISILDNNRQDFQPIDYKAIREDLVMMRRSMQGYMFAQAGYFAYQVAISEPPVPHRDYYLQRVREMIEESEELAASPPAFLHQKTPRSFIHLTRQFRKGLEARGLW